MVLRYVLLLHKSVIYSTSPKVGMSKKVLGGGRCGKEGEYIITIYKRCSDGKVICKVKRVRR
jgi:formylmethanofuran dehydrogenase subunit E